MSDAETTQAQVKSINKKPSHNYDSAPVKTFLETVFHTEPNLAAVCGYAKAGARPGFPVTGDELVTRLTGDKPPMACYYGTATMNIDPRDNRLYNRQANMKAMHVVVLDDIGTKIPKEKMPPGLDPTYKLESSPGNEQWGFVLENPITDVEEAALLVKLVYSSGFTDSGGALCNKIVRLPAGVNGKADTKNAAHPVKLLDMDGPYYTPQGILDALDLGVSWAHLLADPELVRKQLRRQQGTNQLAKVKLRGETAEGVTDIVLDWFYDRNEVLQESDDWFTIRCPWAHEHSSGDGTAGYSPLGYGGTFESSRGFHCFHEHCQARRGKDLVEWVASVGGPQAAAFDPSYALISRVVYDVANDNIYDIKIQDYLDQRTNSYGKASFSTVYPGKVEVELGSGKTFKHSMFDMWSRHPSRVLVHGTVSDPTGGMLVGHEDHPKLNIFQMPEYKRRPHNPEAMAPFVDFIEYLIPNATERKYFLDWLACKAQNLRFRGNAIVMVAEEEGTGRGTLSKIIGKVFGEYNMYNAEFSQIVGAAFNPFMRAMFVTCDETLMSRGEKQKEESYERLKNLIEPTETAITINEKGIRQYTVHGGPSFLFFSNHIDALYMKGQARRFYIIQNPPVPRDATGRPDATRFETIYAWMETDDWETEFWNFLQDRPIDKREMVKPAPETQGKKIMRHDSGSDADRALRAILACWPSDIVIPGKVKELLVNLGLSVSADYDWGKAFSKIKKPYLKDTRGMRGAIGRTQRICGVATNIQVKTEALDVLAYTTGQTFEVVKTKAVMDLEVIVGQNLFANIQANAADLLDLH